MRHSTWRTRRHRELLGEAAAVDPGYEQVYEEAGAAMRLGKAVHDRRRALGLSEADLAARMGLTPDDVETIETATELPSGGVLLRLAVALEVSLDMHVTPSGASSVTFEAAAA